jgi:hypothetical protein
MDLFDILANQLFYDTPPMKSFVLIHVLLLATMAAVFAQQRQTIAVKPMPDVLTMNDGSKVGNKSQWPARRQEILNFYTKEMYGQMPPRPTAMVFKVVEQNANALNGKATRKQVVVYFNGITNGPQMNILIYLPNKVKHPPLIVGLNFYGNQTVINDPAVLIDTSWVDTRAKGMVDYHATEASRGINTGPWPIEMIVDRGYGLATIYDGDIDPDFKGGFSRGVRALYPDLQGTGDNFSTIGAWAWGLSRAMDYFETDKDINPKQVAVFGHSRLGKAALWAGATDQRFVLVISNESGKGGASLFRRQTGEALRHLTGGFPNWFCTNFKKYNDMDADLPFDQHFLLSMIAPRPLYVASAVEDTNSDPEGEFLSAKGSSVVYSLLGKKGLPADSIPPLNQPVIGQVAYHIRPGKHDVTNYDWEQYLNFADLNFKRK